jgi:hypothetical protein
MDESVAVVLVVVVAGSLALLLLVGAILVTRDTVQRRGRWGINLTPLECPGCGEPAPAVRAPKNLRQALWGGCTCPECGLEYDKWGRPVDEDDR